MSPKRKKVKKIKKRDSISHPGLNKGVNAKTRHDLLDYDYIHKLSAEEKTWLDRFSSEWVGAAFEKTASDKYSSKNLHKTAKKRREIYGNNNSRLRCTLTIVNATGYRAFEEAANKTLDDQEALNYPGKMNMTQWEANVLAEMDKLEDKKAKIEYLKNLKTKSALVHQYLSDFENTSDDRNKHPKKTKKL